MLKLVIADDEHRVCQLIQNIIPWNEYGIQIAGVAYNGIDAFHLISQVEPDIVVTDIRMPGYDGISLIEKSRELHREISFIIISGYRDFEYAQSALKFGAEDYLLKPISGEELLKTVLKVVRGKKQKTEQYEEETRLRQELLQSKETLRRQMAKDLIEKDCRTEEREFFKLSEQYHISFSAPFYQVVMIHLDNPDAEGNRENSRITETVLEKTEGMVSAFLENHVGEYICAGKGSRLVYILNTRTAGGISSRDGEQLLEAVTQKITEYGNWVPTVCLGRAADSPGGLEASFREALFAEKDRILRGTGRVLQPRSVIPAGEEIRKLESEDREAGMKAFLDSWNAAGTDSFAADFRSFFPTFSGVANPETIHLFFSRMAARLAVQLKNYDADEPSLESLQREMEKILETSPDLASLVSGAAALFSSVSGKILSSKRSQEYKPIRIAKEYIDLHYPENIDLSVIAREAGLNPIYFSSLFKKETGINFKDYLQQKRIEAARELLLSGNDTIQAVSEKVGYRDVRYFSRIFFKTVGIKPNMYRKIYG